MNTVAIVQARMGSTRLPGKVLLTAAGKTLLAWHLERLAQVPGIDRIVVATTELPADEAIAEHAAALGADVFCGSEHDVLDRYYKAALRFHADRVLRTTSDCPLLDPALVERLLQRWQADSFDYLSAATPQHYPRGMDCELLAIEALRTAWEEGREPDDREHVTPFLYRRPERFRLGRLEPAQPYPDYRLTVDTAEDLQLVRHVLDALGAGPFGLDDIHHLFQRHPQWLELNAQVCHKEFTYDR